jgi:hypothetical protein
MYNKTTHRQDGVQIKFILERDAAAQLAIVFK